MSGKISKTGVHEWKNLTEYVIESKDFRGWEDCEIETRLNVLAKLPKDHYVVLCTRPATETDTRYFQRQIKALIKYGLDVGGGNAMYGYKMPLPEKEEAFRELRIFKRK